MDERDLLILGLLMTQSQHGYQINDFIERNLGRVSDMKKSTAYAILKRLHKSGYVSVETGQEGNRPVKMVFSITEAGERRFEELLRHTMVQVSDVTPAGDIGIMFLDHLPVEEALGCLQERLRNLNRLIESYGSVPVHGHGFGVDLSIRHRLALLRADRDWLTEAIASVQAGGRR